MLTSLALRNFKSWKDTGPIRLAPITVFFGSNSAGKTSILQALLMMKQTAESQDRARVLHTGDKTTYVELGNYTDLIHGHDSKLDLSFELEWELPEELKINDPLSDKAFTGNKMAFESTVGNGPKGTPYVKELQYLLLQENDNPVSVKMSARAGKGNAYDLSSSEIALKRFPGRPWPLPPPARFYGFPDEVTAYFQNAGFASQLALELERQLRRLYYLGPLREDPSRTYTWSGEQPEHVGKRGDRAIEAMLSAKDRLISAGPRRRGNSLAQIISKWLSRLELLDHFETKQIASGRKEYEVSVTSKGSNSKVLLPEVGFGISQVLPVVVECFYAPAGSTLIMEQPELHLHPRVQSHLADLFIEAVNAREKNKSRDLQLVIESHSEHFLRRLQLRVAEGVIEPDQVALYFCSPGPDGSKITTLEVDMFGDIRNWPNDFFGDEMGDLAARLQAASKKELTAR